MKEAMKRFRFAALSIAILFFLSGAESDEPRAQLIRYLDDIATSHLKQRQQAISQLHSRADAERRQAMVREKMLALMGGLPTHSSAVAIKEFGGLAGDGFRVEKLAYESLPGFWVTANLYVPAASKGPFPAVIIAPGHGAAGKLEDWSWGANFARNGIVALAYDPLGQGERLQYFDPGRNASLVGNPTGEHGEANVGPMLIGDDLARYMVNDAMRGIDYLSSRKDVNAGRIGAFGCSGGGTATAYLAALDARVKAAATACYITSFEQLLPSATGVQDAEQTIPHFIENNLDIADWVEVFAPKPYAIISTTEDMFPFEGAKQSYEEAKHVYSLYGAEDNVQWFTGPGGHGNIVPMGPRIMQFFTKNLKGSNDEPTFTALKLEDRDSLRCTPTGQVATSIGGETVFSLNKKRAGDLISKWAPISGKQLQTAIRTLSGAGSGRAAATVDTKSSEQREGYKLETIALHFDGGMTISGFLAIPDKVGPKPALLMLGMKPDPELAKSGTLVLALESLPTPAGTESIKSPYLGPFNLLSLRAFLVGKTIIGMRIDIALQAIDLLCARKDVDRESITVHGYGPLGLVALHAAVLDPRITKVIEQNALATYASIVEQPLHRNVSEVVIPGVLLKYDTDDLVRATYPRSVTVINPLDALGKPVSPAAGAARSPR